MRPKSLTLTIAVLLAGSGVLPARMTAQNPQEPSIAEAARINREQKKGVPKTAPVITDDTFGPPPSSKPPAASPPAAAPQATQAPDNLAQNMASADSRASTASTKPELSKEDADRLKAEIATIMQELKDKQSEVELLQRLLNLDREAFNSKPDSSRRAEGKSKLDAEQDELQQKSEEFEKLKAKLQGVAPELTSTQAPPKS
jgi:hypothetical protein